MVFPKFVNARLEILNDGLKKFRSKVLLALIIVPCIMNSLSPLLRFRYTISAMSLAIVFCKCQIPCCAICIKYECSSLSCVVLKVRLVNAGLKCSRIGSRCPLKKGNILVPDACGCSP